MTIFRQYTRDASFTKVTELPFEVDKFQVALLFAIDSNCNGPSPPDGNFTPSWDTNKVTPNVISTFKAKELPFQVEFLVCIGDQDEKYSFATNASQRDLWVRNATSSLKKIIDDYHLDGIDVYHEHINQGSDFVDCIGTVMQNLKQIMNISTASISPTAPLNTEFYIPLFNKYQNFIDTVVYQCYTETQPIKEAERLVSLYEDIGQSYPKQKLLAGQSTLSKDWGSVPPNVFYIASLSLLEKQKIS
ncbi:ruBisCO-associated protein-like [Lotus japonicus]|uniref:ruBisCO-associated protein-like n=1 Tax=Lotus japonicus TaxID=34305 RepID=UPI00258958BF|nr:ruBisCO-associated protein-like [Lotus japonicus]